ncbi:MAG TPA: hypothetical protein DIT10_12810 [Chryseobacterium sp.]|nr:hypothetical protein [Chryseobacterium sp.]
MKNKLILLALLSAGSMAIAQVGINTPQPQASLDVASTPPLEKKLDGIIAPRLSGADLNGKNYTPAQMGAIVYVTLPETTPTGQTIDVQSPGYYYFDGAKWIGLLNNTSGWRTVGNMGTAASAAALGSNITTGNYLGTGDAQSLVIATQKNVKGILDVNGTLQGGNANTAGPYASFTWGSNNKLTNNTSSNVAIGKDNTVAAQGANFPGLAIGSGNTITNGAKVIGNANVANGANNLVFGNNNTASGTLGLIVGNGNTNNGGIIIGGGSSAITNNFTFGSNNKADTGDKALVIGFSGTAGAGQSVYANSSHVFLAQGNGSNSVVGINMFPTTDGSGGAAIQIKGFASAANATCTAAEEGAIRYNSTTKSHEGCNGTNWKAFY